MVSQHALQFPRQTHTQRGSWEAWLGGGSRPTPRGEVEGSGWGGLQAHTQGGSWGVWTGGSPGPHPGGVYPSMHWGRPPPPQADGYCCGRYTSYWNAFLLGELFGQNLLQMYIYLTYRAMITRVVYLYLALYGCKGVCSWKVQEKARWSLWLSGNYWMGT